jgi:predicted CopG family antitoxin
MEKERKVGDKAFLKFITRKPSKAEIAKIAQKSKRIEKTQNKIS